MSMDKVITPLAYSTSGTLLVFGLTLNDIACIVGILTGIGTFFINLYFKRKEFNAKQRARENPRFSISPLD